MNVLEKQIAVDVMRKIIRRPIARLFSTNDLTGVTLNDIAERLDRGLFPSFDAWKSQVESLFDQYAKHKTDSVSVSAQQLKSEFESELEKLLPQKNAHCYEMTKLREQLGMIAKDLDTPLAVIDAEPASVAFQAQDGACARYGALRRMGTTGETRGPDCLYVPSVGRCYEYAVSCAFKLLCCFVFAQGCRNTDFGKPA